MKKFSRNVLIFALIATVFVPTLLMLGGCPIYYEEDGIHYTIYDDYAEVNYFESNEDGGIVCEVPSHVVYDDKIYPVTTVCPDTRGWGDRYSFVEGKGYAVEIILPETVTDFRYNEYGSTKYPQNGDLNRLEKITVHSGNLVYSDVDGVLFTKEKTELLYYPYAKPNADFTFPKEAQSIADDSLLWQNEIVEELKVEEGSEAFSAIDGVLFDADGEEMLYYPLNRQQETYTIPESMLAINPQSMFWSNEYISKIEVDAGNVYFESDGQILYSYGGSELVYRLANDDNYFAIPSTVSVVCYNALPGVDYLYVPKSVTLFLESFVSCDISVYNIGHVYFESDTVPNYMTKSNFRGELFFGKTLEEFEAARKN